MERQVILLEDLIDVFEQELGHVFEAVNPPGPGRPPVYPATALFQGNHVVVDASLVHAYSNPRKKGESGTPSDPEASWGFDSSTGQWVYGYKLHLVACADAELPIALAVTTGKRGLSPRFPPLLTKASCFPIPLRVVGADGNYHAAANHLAAHRLGAATVIPLPARRHREPQTLAQRLRLHPLIERGSAVYRRLERKRQSIERVFARLKSHFRLDHLRVRGLAQVTPHVLLALTSMLVYALTAATLGCESLVRSPTRLTA
jgi:hypothetical protein